MRTKTSRLVVLFMNDADRDWAIGNAHINRLAQTTRLLSRKPEEAFDGVERAAYNLATIAVIAVNVPAASLRQFTLQDEKPVTLLRNRDVVEVLEPSGADLRDARRPLLMRAVVLDCVLARDALIAKFRKQLFLDCSRLPPVRQQMEESVDGFWWESV